MPDEGVAAYLIHCLRGVGISQDNGSPLTSSELTAWAQGAGHDLGCIDFQDILDASRAYIAAYATFTDTNAPCPWRDDAPDQSDANAEERAWDMIMGC